MLLMFGAGGDVGVLFGKDADNASGNFVADYSLVVLANDIDSEFLGGDDSKGLKGKNWAVLGRIMILVRIIHSRALLGRVVRS